MSTRGVIALENPDKTCRAIYVHFDMYPDGGGLCLINHYTTPERVEQLLALGGLSALGDKLSDDDPEPDAQDVCIAYHRDYGEDLEAPDEWESADKLLEQAHESYWAEYVYLFRDDEWVFDTPYHPKGWRSVKQTLRVESRKKLTLLPDDEMTFSVEPGRFGDLILTAECHKDDSGRKISVGIRLDQIPQTCSSRNELVKFIDNYARCRKTDGLLVPRDEYKFHLGFAPETGQVLLFPEMMIRDGFVQTDRIVLSDLPKDARTVKGLESTLVSRNKGQVQIGNIIP